MSPPSQRKVTLMALVVLIWILGSLFGLYWFQQQSMRPFVEASDPASARDPAIVEAGLRELLLRLPESEKHSDHKVTVVHLWNPDCLCNSVSARHTSAIINEWPDSPDVRFVILTPTSTSDESLSEARKVYPNAVIMKALPTDALPLTASPGLGIVSATGDMAYFGAYGFGALCTLSDEALFTNMIKQLLSGKDYGPFLNIAGSGCFCDWPTATDSAP